MVSEPEEKEARVGCRSDRSRLPLSFISDTHAKDLRLMLGWQVLEIESCMQVSCVSIKG